jgi:hypothetical protein
MRLSLSVAAFVSLLFAAVPAAAVDFDKLDRHIARAPAYQSKPLYCLALIGPDARTRVWMVLDGERLFVDRNCNGDLTDDGPSVEVKDNTEPAPFEENCRVPGRRPDGLQVRRHPLGPPVVSGGGG